MSMVERLVAAWRQRPSTERITKPSSDRKSDPSSDQKLTKPELKPESGGQNLRGGKRVADYLAEQKALGSAVDECIAFHGTRRNNVDSIFRDGFQLSRGGSLGPGVYLTICVKRARMYAGKGGAVIRVRALVQGDERRKLDICVRNARRIIPLSVRDIK